MTTNKHTRSARQQLLTSGRGSALLEIMLLLPVLAVVVIASVQLLYWQTAYGDCSVDNRNRALTAAEAPGLATLSLKAHIGTRRAPVFKVLQQALGEEQIVGEDHSRTRTDSDVWCVAP